MANTYTFHNPSSGSSYFNFETPPIDGVYPMGTPKIMEKYSLYDIEGMNPIGVVESDYRFSLVIPPGTSSIKFSQMEDIAESGSQFKGTGEFDLEIVKPAFGTILATSSSYSAKQLKSYTGEAASPKNPYFQFTIAVEDPEDMDFSIGGGTGGTIDNSFSVDWGDGNSRMNDVDMSTVSNAYAELGTYTVRISGSFNYLSFGTGGTSTNKNDWIKSVENWGDLIVSGSMSGVNNIFRILYDAGNMGAITAVDVLDTSGLTNLWYAFYKSSFSDPGNSLNKWDVSNVTSFERMFYQCDNFNGKLSNWNTSNVTDMNYTFAIAEAFNQNIGNWDVSKVDDFGEMFMDATAFNNGGSPDISRWNFTGSGGVKTDWMFQGTTSFNQDIGGWDTSQFTNVSGMFAWNTVFNQNLGKWDVSNVGGGNYQWMFDGATAFNNGGSPSINDWDMSSCTNLKNMFKNASSFNQPIGNWDTSNVTDFTDCLINTSYNQDLNGWDLSSGTTIGGFLAGSPFNQDVSSWSGSLPSGTKINGLFLNAAEFNNGGSPLLWNPSGSGITSITSLFSGTNFNQDISNWDIATITTFTSFIGLSPFNQDLSSWSGSFGPAFSLANIFSNTTAFNNGGSANINDWDVSNSTGFAYLCYNAEAFNQPIGDWDVSNSTGYDYYMFYGATSFNQDISNWKLNQGVTYWGYGNFYNASSFDQNLGNLALPSGSAFSFYPAYIFFGSGMSTANYTDTIVGWANNISASHGSSGTANLNSKGMSGQTGMTFDNARSGGTRFTNAEASRTWLTGTLGWTISGDTVIN